MMRSVTVMILILVAALIICGMPSGNVYAKDENDKIEKLLENQEVILERIGTIEKKLKQIDDKIDIMKKNVG